MLILCSIGSVDISLHCTILLTNVYFQAQIFTKSKTHKVVQNYYFSTDIPEWSTFETTRNYHQDCTCLVSFILFWFISEGPQNFSRRTVLERVECGPSRLITWPIQNKLFSFCNAVSFCFALRLVSEWIKRNEINLKWKAKEWQNLRRSTDYW